VYIAGGVVFFMNVYSVNAWNSNLCGVYALLTEKVVVLFTPEFQKTAYKYTQNFPFKSADIVHIGLYCTSNCSSYAVKNESLGNIIQTLHR
jgi:hypothetical protein